VNTPKIKGAVPSGKAKSGDSGAGSALRLPDFFATFNAGAESDGVIFVSSDEAGEKGSADAGDVKLWVYNEKVHGPHGGKTWEQLGHKQKEAWKQKLKSAGHWAEDMGETLLKGVVFGELGGAVGQAIGG